MLSIAISATALLAVTAPGVVVAQQAAAPTAAIGGGSQADREALAAHAIGINFAFMEVSTFV